MARGYMTAEIPITPKWLIEARAAEAAEAAALVSTSQAKPAVADTWARAIAAARGTAPAESTPAEPSEPKDFGWSSAFAAAHQRAATEGSIEVNPDATPPDAALVSSWDSALAKARSGQR